MHFYVQFPIRLLYFQTLLFNYVFGMLSQEIFFVNHVACCYSPAA